jgi:Ribosome biogenesis regulatory protein (RRS1)
MSSRSVVPDRDDNLSYDLGNLYALDIISVDMRAYKSDRERCLLAESRDATQLLFNKIFAQPTRRLPNGEGIVAELPGARTRLPRQKPVPELAPATPWQEFAKIRGIQNNAKRDRLVWDDTVKEWRPRYGRNRANTVDNDWVIEAKETDEVGSDPWIEARRAKRERVAKQRKQESKNATRADAVRGVGGAGSRKKTLLGVDGMPVVAVAPLDAAAMRRNDKKKARRQSARAGTGDDNDTDTIDVHIGRKTSGDRQDSKQIASSLAQANSSTASLGRFNELQRGEKNYRISKLSHGRKPNVQETGEERTAALKVLDRVFMREQVVDKDTAARRAIGKHHEQSGERQVQRRIEKREKKRRRK